MTGLAEISAPWVDSMCARGLNRRTIIARRNLLARWWQHCAGRPFEATWHDVETFVGRDGAAGSRYNRISQLHRFYVWARRQGLTEHDPTELARRPRLRAGLPRPIDDHALAVALARSTNPHRAAIIVAATCGLRCCELARLRWTDLTESTIRVTGKGDRARVIPLHPAARSAFDELDRTGELVFPWPAAPGALDPGGRTTRNLNRHLRSIGVDATAHQLRHWCGSKALAATGDLRAVQALLGHASPSTTATYAAADPNRTRSAVDAISFASQATADTPERCPVCGRHVSKFGAGPHRAMHRREHANRDPQPEGEPP